MRLPQGEIFIGQKRSNKNKNWSGSQVAGWWCRWDDSRSLGSSSTYLSPVRLLILKASDQGPSDPRIQTSTKKHHAMLSSKNAKSWGEWRLSDNALRVKYNINLTFPVSEFNVPNCYFRVGNATHQNNNICNRGPTPHTPHPTTSKTNDWTPLLSLF